MADNDAKILKALDALQADVSTIKAVQQGHGKNLDNLLEEASRTRTVMKTLENKVDETKAEVDEIKKRQRPRNAD